MGEAMPLLDTVPERATERGPWVWIAVAALFAIAAAVGWWRSTRPAPLPLHPLVRVSIELPPDTTVYNIRNGNRIALSSDGTHLAVALRDAAGKYRLATRRLDPNELALLSPTEGASMPFFSPDGQWIGFFADGKLKKIAFQGGSPVTLCDAPNPVGASWGDDDNII